MTALADALAGARVYDLEQPRYAGAPVWPAHEPGHAAEAAPPPRAGAGGGAHERLRAARDGRALRHAHRRALPPGREPLHARRRRGRRRRCRRPRASPSWGPTRSRRCSRAACCSTAPTPATRSAPDDLERAAEGLEIRPGDVILVRTGTGALWEDPEAFLAAGGIDASGSRWCAERRPLAVGADNVAWDVPGEVDPELGSLPGHLILLVREGIYIIEALNLEELARRRRARVRVRLPAAEVPGRDGLAGAADRAGVASPHGDPLLPRGPGPLHLGHRQRAGHHHRRRRHRGHQDARRERQPDRPRLRRERDRRAQLGPRVSARRPDRGRGRRAGRHARGRDPRHPRRAAGAGRRSCPGSGCWPTTSRTPT